jgi:hypothetical protein
MKAGVVRPGQCGEELRCPRTAVAAVGREAFIDLQSAVDGHGDEHLLAAHIHEIVVILDAIETVAVGDLVLTQEDFARAFEGWRNDEAATLVVESGQDDGGRGGFFYALQPRPFSCGAGEVDDGDRL